MVDKLPVHLLNYPTAIYFAIIPGSLSGLQISCNISKTANHLYNTMPGSGSGGSRQPRGAYSRLICLGCRDRRIRCELPNEVEIPDPRELRTVQTPCYRCKRLGIPCIVRQTILGRPSSGKNLSIAEASGPIGTEDIVSRIIIELPSRSVVRTRPVTVESEVQPDHRSVVRRSRLPSPNCMPLRRRNPARWIAATPLIQNPQSNDAVIIIRAIDTLRCEKVEKEWFRHLPTHVGHTWILDLSIKALVAACAYTRGVPKLTSGDCYQALALALNAVQANMKDTHGEFNDDVLASTALLAHFEAAMMRHGVPMRLHVEGLAAIIAARPATYPVTDLAREILDFHICDSAIMACINGIPSPFESIPRAYFVSDRIRYNDSDQVQLKALGSELFIRIPRLVELVRSLRAQPQERLLLEASSLLKSLLQLQNPQAEERVLLETRGYLPGGPESTSLFRSLNFASVGKFEALAYYWQNRLSLLRLEQHLLHLSMLANFQAEPTNQLMVPFGPQSRPGTDEMFRLATKILMCAEYAATLPLHKHARLFTHAMVTVWGTITDVPVILDYIQDEEGIGCLSELLLRRTNFILVVKPPLTDEDMNVAANVFVGGDLKGRFVELYHSYGL